MLHSYVIIPTHFHINDSAFPATEVGTYNDSINLLIATAYICDKN